jgi:hypothetical protein
MPVCDAAVEIYEVEPLPRIIWKLPDLGIERIRSVILNDRVRARMQIGSFQRSHRMRRHIERLFGQLKIHVLTNLMC